MKRVTAQTRRGQPLIALGLLLVGWAGVRGLVWASSQPDPSEEAPALEEVAAVKELARPNAAEPRAAGVGGLGSAVIVPAPRAHFVPVSPPVWPSASSSSAQAIPSETDAVLEKEPAKRVPPRIAGGHQLLWMAALSQLPMPDLAVPPGEQAAGHRPGRSISPARWSADGWLLLRRGGNAFNLPGAGLPGANLPSGTYGASQAGAVIRYRLAPASPAKPTLYLRGTSALQSPRGEELAFGLSLRPLPRVALAAMVEGRATKTMTGTVVRPAAALVSELPPADLPLGLRGEAYVQGGYVGGRDATAFVDGQARVERRLGGAGRWQLRAGAGTWGGAQKGARRLDVGPTATFELPLGPVGGRLSADWRFRVAGNSAPGSGPALTLSAGF